MHKSTTVMRKIPGLIRTMLEPPTDEPYCQFPVHYHVRSNFFLKNILDKIGALVGLALTLPVWLITAVLIKCGDGGTVFFKQARVGKDGKTFYMLKFRTMVPDAENLKNSLLEKSDIKGAFKMKDDPRVTDIGRFLRKFKIDELPQFLNVLFGTMSLVGPRPTSLEEVRRSYGEETCQKFISGMKPGVTGWTQVKESLHGKFDLQDQVTYDLEYIKNQSIALDIMILIITIPAIILGRGN
jgi:lipopolysaccharide/colanic/teichoic acid biosynthesis glycosyltransferase